MDAASAGQARTGAGQSNRFEAGGSNAANSRSDANYSSRGSAHEGGTDQGSGIWRTGEGHSDQQVPLGLGADVLVHVREAVVSIYTRGGEASLSTG